MRTISDYFYFYERFLLQSWHNMTPAQYGCLLISIAVAGWLMMKSGGR